MDSLAILLWVYGLFFLISLVAAIFKAHYKTLFLQVIFPQLAAILLLCILLAATSLISNGKHEARDLIMGEILPGCLLAGGMLGWLVVGRRKHAGALCHLFMLLVMLGLTAVSHPVLWPALNCDEGWYWELGPLPWLYSYVSTLLLILAFFYRRCRQILLWVMLPQWAVVGGLLFALDYFDLLGGAWLALILAVPVYLCVGVFPAIVLGFWMKRTWPVWLLCHLLFLGSTQVVIPDLWRGFIPAWQEKSRIALLEQTKRGDLSELQDISDRDALEKLLSQAAKDPSTPEKTLRFLTRRVASPFKFSNPELAEECCGLEAPFFAAFSHGNQTAVQIFSEALKGDSAQAKENRAIVREQNPLRFIPGGRFPEIVEKRRLAFVGVSDILLRVMPELLTEEAYLEALQEWDKNILASYWQRRAPTTPLYRAYGLFRLEQYDAFIALVTQDPQLLERSLISNNSLLKILFEYADASLIQRILNASIIPWEPILAGSGEAFRQLLLRTVHGPNSLPPEVLVTALQQIQKQKAPLPESQIVNAITGKDNPVLVNAYHRAGLTCDALFAMIDRVYPEGDVSREVTLNLLHEQCRNE